MWSYWPAVLGFVIVAFTLREVYQDLFHPSATGSLSDFVASTTFNLFRYVPGFLSDAGPLAVVLVIFMWAASVCVGFALIYWAMPPGYFKIEAGRPQTGFLAMVYFSLEVLTTLGLGDYAPVPIWLRLLVTFEALVGFGVLTASVSSIILVHSALARLRTLAGRISTVIRAEDEMKFSFDADDAQQMLAEFSASVIRTRVDVIQFPVVYYFYSDPDHASLPQGCLTSFGLPRRGWLNRTRKQLEESAALLRIALRDLAEALRGRFVTSATEDCEAVFQAYAMRGTITMRLRNSRRHSFGIRATRESGSSSCKNLHPVQSALCSWKQSDKAALHCVRAMMKKGRFVRFAAPQKERASVLAIQVPIFRPNKPLKSFTDLRLYGKICMLRYTFTMMSVLRESTGDSSATRRDAARRANSDVAMNIENCE